MQKKNKVMLAAAIGMGADLVRIGFEDSKFIDAEQRAENNLQLVEKLATLIRAMDREIATPDEALELLYEWLHSGLVRGLLGAGSGEELADLRDVAVIHDFGGRGHRTFEVGS